MTDRPSRIETQYPRFTPDLLTGVNECPHGVSNGRALRPDVGTPACPFCRRQYEQHVAAGDQLAAGDVA